MGFMNVPKGQLFSFMVDMIFFAIVIVIILLRKQFWIEPSTFTILGLLQISMSNIALFISSPELRRKYFLDDTVWIPRFCFE